MKNPYVHPSFEELPDEDNEFVKNDPEMEQIKIDTVKFLFENSDMTIDEIAANSALSVERVAAIINEMKLNQ